MSARLHPTGTIARYWQDHGHTFEEAGRIEHEQIAAAMAQAADEALYEAGAWNAEP